MSKYFEGFAQGFDQGAKHADGFKQGYDAGRKAGYRDGELEIHHKSRQEMLDSVLGELAMFRHGMTVFPNAYEESYIPVAQQVIGSCIEILEHAYGASDDNSYPRDS
jgi:flagellar biosynthesis/type III secretory pathway protein FliH